MAYDFPHPAPIPCRSDAHNRLKTGNKQPDPYMFLWLGIGSFSGWAVSGSVCGLGIHGYDGRAVWLRGTI
eukprot:scaffold721_cov327-Prasinococcus_capsulatus_cf.AAC.5